MNVLKTWLGVCLAFAVAMPLSAEVSHVVMHRDARSRILATPESKQIRATLDAAARAMLWSVDDRESCQLQLPASGQHELTLDLERFKVLTPDARFMRGTPNGSIAMAQPQVLLLRGAVQGEPGSRAFISMTSSGRVWGSFSRASGEQLVVRTTSHDDAATTVIIGPAAPIAGDVPDAIEFCGTHTEPMRLPEKPLDGIAGGDGTEGAGGPATLTSRGPRTLVVAVDADQSFAQLFPSELEAQEYIVQLIGAVSDIYIRDLNFRLLLDFSRVWPAGGEPFSASNLSGFRNYWINNEDLDGLNLVHLFSGRRNLSYGGIAYLADACNQFGFGISGFLLGSFPQPVNWPNLGNWDVVVVAHEMGHNLGTPHTHDYMPAIDQCTSGVWQRGTIMSYCHTNPGGLLNTDVRMHRRVADLIAENNAAPGDGACLWHDCNGNGVRDSDELQVGPFVDLNRNGILDECEDCDGNGILDPTDIFLGAPDVNTNGIIDTCEHDCNANGLPDEWEVRMGFAPDLNGNAIPDACEADCDSNGVPDFTDILAGTHTDINRNAVPDVCEDCNANGIADWIDVDRQFNIYIGQATGDSPVREYHAISAVPIGDVSPAAIDGAYDLAFGSDRQLYVASFADDRIVKVDVDANTASDFVSTGSGGLDGPSALTFGPDGHLYVCSQNTASVIRYHGQTGAFVDVFVSAGSGGLISPWGLAFGPNGNLFVISGNSMVLEFDGTSGVFVSTFVDGLNVPQEAALNDPRDLVFLPNGSLLVTNRGGNRITHYAANGDPIGTFNDHYPLSQPWGIMIGRPPGGNVFATRTTGTEVRIIEYDVNTGSYIRAFVRGDPALTNPAAIAIRPASPNDANGNDVPDSCEGAVCPGDVAPAVGNQVVDIDDLLVVINHWGETGTPGTIPGDIYPPNGGDGTVNIDDLLVIINAWGPCP